MPSKSKNPHISRIIDPAPLPEVIYNDTQSNEHPVSPTFSQMRTPSELNQNTKVTFQVNRCYLNKEFYQDYNQPRRKWFFAHFSKDM